MSLSSENPRVERPKMKRISRPNPFSYAALIAIPYLLFSLIYVVSSGMLAEAMSRDAQHLASIERFKGIIFITLSSLLLFVLADRLFRRILKQKADLDMANKTVMMLQNKAVAGIFASSIAHDMNNLMMGLYNDIQEYSQQEHLEASEKERAQRLEFVAREMMALARKLSQSGNSELPGAPETIDLGNCVQGILEFARHHRTVKYCRVEEEIHSAAPIVGIPVILRQVILNLVLNAAQATKHGEGRIRIVCRNTVEGTELEVHDNGPGVPVEMRKKIFEAYVSDKEGGSGLGLYSVKAGVELHGGWVEVDDSPLGGALFRFVIPSGSREYLEMV